MEPSSIDTRFLKKLLILAERKEKLLQGVNEIENEMFSLLRGGAPVGVKGSSPEGETKPGRATNRKRVRRKKRKSGRVARHAAGSSASVTAKNP